MTEQLIKHRCKRKFPITVAGALLAACAGERAPHDPVEVTADVSSPAFVHLFEWSWPEVADECEQFLGPKQFAAVQVSPPNEHIALDPWWARYQPVSYQLDSRGGTRAEFIDMVERCAAVGVDIYADVVMNHTAAWEGGGVGVAGTAWSYKNHPANPRYAPEHYHDTCGIDNYGDAGNVQNCELVGLPDLDTSQAYVQDQIAGYMADLRAIGVAGFRIDAAKHMAPEDIDAVLQRAGDPYVFLEVIGASGEAVQPRDYTHLGEVTEFGFGADLGRFFRAGRLCILPSVLANRLPSEQAVIFTDNHDNQRGHGGGGDPLTHRDVARYELGNVFMLAWPYGHPKVMSSYRFEDSDQGPPSGGGGCANPERVCEHRLTAIANMVEFRQIASSEGVANWWDNSNNQIAFSRGDKGFVVINREGAAIDDVFVTGLPEGIYCDVASGDFDAGACAGREITVTATGEATVSLDGFSALAIHVGAQLDGSRERRAARATP